MSVGEAGLTQRENILQIASSCPQQLVRGDPTPDELEASYAESVRTYNAAREEERRAEWYSYHLDQAERLRRTLEPLIALHEARAAALCEEVPRG